jgi:hypothetical protein
LQFQFVEQLAGSVIVHDSVVARVWAGYEHLDGHGRDHRELGKILQRQHSHLGASRLAGERECVLFGHLRVQ